MFGRRRTRPGQVDARHLLAAQAIAAGLNQSVAAERSGASERTIRDWAKEKWFQDMVADELDIIGSRVRAETAETAIRHKINRIYSLQEIHDRGIGLMRTAAKPQDMALGGRLAMDALAETSKELGEQGRPLQEADDEGNPVINVNAPDVDEEEEQ